MEQAQRETMARLIDALERAQDPDEAYAALEAVLKELEPSLTLDQRADIELWMRPVRALYRSWRMIQELASRGPEVVDA